MKIIFDSEEQKERFLNTVVRCPSDFGLEDNEENCKSGRCCECWEKAVECEVKKSE